MTSTVTAPAAPTAQRARLFAPEAADAAGRSLEESVLAAWNELQLRGTAPCLVCGSALDAEGRCAACGAELG